MATFSKVKLSGSTDGKGIAVAATASPGTTIHTATAGTTNFDEVYLYVNNIHTGDVQVTIQWGGTAAVDGIIVTIPFKAGLVLVIPGLILDNSNIIRVFAGTPNVINVYGFVNRIA